MHATATFNGKVIAETDAFESVEGNVYVLQPLSPISRALDTDVSCSSLQTR